MNYARRAGYALAGGALFNVPGAVAGYEYARRTEQSSPKSMKRKASVSSIPSRPRKKAKTVSIAKTSKNMKKASKYQKRLFKAAKKRMISKRGGSYIMESFKKPTRKGYSKIANIETKCLTLGWGVTSENVGTVTDEHAAYIYHGTFESGAIQFALAGALIRSLFRKAGIEFGNLDEEIPFVDVNDSSGFRIQLTVRNSLTMAYVVWNVFDSTNNKTFRDVVTGSSLLRQYIQEYMENVTGFEPYSLALYSTDGDGYRLASLMYLQDEMVVFHASSLLAVQNRTKAAVVDSNDAFYDRVDNQPLKGYIYEFSNGDPRLRANQLKGTGVAPTTSDIYYSTGSLDGCRTFGSTVTTGPTLANNMQELPVPKFWKNCNKASKIVLDPGYIKKTYISVQYKNRFPELLKKFRATTADNVTYMSFSMLRSHKSQIVAVEEVLRTDSANKISLYFEREGKCGAYTYSKSKKKTLSTYYRQGTITQSTTVVT